MTSTLLLSDRAAVLRYLEALQAAGELPEAAVNRSALLVLLADCGHRLHGALAVDNVPGTLPQPARVRTLGPLLRRIRSSDHAAAAVVLVHVRMGSTEALGGDAGWCSALSGASKVAGLTDLGTYVCTPAGAVAVPRDLSAA